jgi:hypothetical protein
MLPQEPSVADFFGGDVQRDTVRKDSFGSGEIAAATTRERSSPSQMDSPQRDEIAVITRP